MCYDGVCRIVTECVFCGAGSVFCGAGSVCCGAGTVCCGAGSVLERGAEWITVREEGRG